MFRIGNQTRVLLTVLCILVVMLRIGGAHMHLCFDGSEPPATLHLDNDSGLHHEHDEHAGGSVEVKHNDIDVALSADAVVKKVTLDFDFLALLASVVLLLYSLPSLLRLLPVVDLTLPFAAHRAHLRPLFRGPPL